MSTEKSLSLHPLQKTGLVMGIIAAIIGIVAIITSAVASIVTKQVERDKLRIETDKLVIERDKLKTDRGEWHSLKPFLIIGAMAVFMWNGAHLVARFVE